MNHKPSNSNSIYDHVRHYTIAIAASGQPADIYYPVVPSSTSARLPIALMLQGALVDKAEYSNYAETVASYGFVVAVPNHQRTMHGLNGQAMTGLLAEEEQVNDMLAQIKLEAANAASPIFKIVDTSKLGLLGHSFGAYVGLAAIQNINYPNVSTGEFTQPPELKAGIFYGASFQAPPYSGTFPPINNQGIPIGLIAGTLDGIANYADVATTYVKIKDPPKALIEIEGANHYSIANQDSDRDPNRPTLDQAAATDAIAQVSGLFLRANLLGDRRAFDLMFNASAPFSANVSIVSQTQTAQ